MVYLAVVLAQLTDPIRVLIVGATAWFLWRTGNEKEKILLPTIFMSVVAAVLISVFLYETRQPLGAFGRSVVMGVITNLMISSIVYTAMFLAAVRSKQT